MTGSLCSSMLQRSRRSKDLDAPNKMNRQAFITKLVAFAANSPEADEFVSDKYEFVMDDDDVKHLGSVLKHNTSVKKFDLRITGLRQSSSVKDLSHFLRNSPSLREITLRGMVEAREQNHQIMDKLFRAMAENQHVTRLDLALHDCCFVVPSFLWMLRTSNSIWNLTFRNKRPEVVGLSRDEGVQVARAFAENESVFYLEMTQLDANLLDPMLTACVKRPTLGILCLEGFRGKSQAQAIGNILACNETIFCLMLSRTTLDRECVEPLLTGFCQNKTLKSLSIRSCKMDVSAAAMITEIFRANTGLKRLALTCIQGCDSAIANAILPGLHHNITIEKLDLFYSHSIIAGSVGGDCMKNLLQRNRRLASLDLSHNPLGTNGAHGVAEGLRDNQFLTSLDLKSCSIQDDGVISIARSLLSNSSLARLCLDCNRIGPPACSALADALRRNESLTWLSLIGNREIGDDGAIFLAEMLIHNRKLENLKLNSCGIQDEGVAALFQALEVNRTLCHLSMHYSVQLGTNAYGEKGFLQLASSLPKMNGLHTLHLTWDNCLSNSQTRRALVSGLDRNASLKEFQLYGSKFDQVVRAKVSYYLRRNRMSPLLAATTDVIPLGFWPSVLESSSPSVIFYCLSKRPSLTFSATVRLTASLEQPAGGAATSNATLKRRNDEI